MGNNSNNHYALAKLVFLLTLRQRIIPHKQEYISLSPNLISIVYFFNVIYYEAKITLVTLTAEFHRFRIGPRDQHVGPKTRQVPITIFQLIYDL